MVLRSGKCPARFAHKYVTWSGHRFFEMVESPWACTVNRMEASLLNILLQINDVKSNAMNMGLNKVNQNHQFSPPQGHGISHFAFSPVSSQSNRALRFPNTRKINQSIESMRQAMATKL